MGAAYDEPLDEGILRTVWMDYDELLASRKTPSSLVLQCVDDYLQGKRAPLKTIPGTLKQVRQNHCG